MSRIAAGLTEAIHAWRNRLATPELWARAHYGNLERCRDAARQHLGREVDLRVLDLGCGRAPHATMVFQAWRWRPTGIDLGPVEGWWGRRFVHEVRTEGLARALRSIARQALVEPRYYRELGRAAGRYLPRRGLDIRHMNACRMDLADGEFDLAFSNAVLEHIDDAGGALAEVARVLKRDGLIYIGFGPFHSLSGGHHPAWQRLSQGVIPRDVPPWDHLRERRHPAPVYVNGMRLGEYRAEFERRFEIIEWRQTQEGREFLTPQIRQELSDYTEEELVTRTVTVIARNPR